MTSDVIALVSNRRTGFVRRWLSRFARVLLRRPLTVLGAALVLVPAVCAVLAPWLAPYGPNVMAVGPILGPPQPGHWFGTDEFGRDVLSRVIWGGRETLFVGLLATAISLGSGLTAGLLAGYASGWVERVFMRALDVLFSFTEILIALACVAVLGPNLTNATIAVGIAGIPVYGRITYGLVLVERSKPYFESARTIGAGHARIIFLHLLPNILPSLIVIGTIGISTAILAASGLSFLGLGAQPPTAEWGAMLASSRNYFDNAPWLLIFPGLAIMLVVLGFNLLGDGVREILDPRQRR